jgi:hypothetical protein
LQEWETGAFRQIPFKAELYGNYYKGLLDELETLGNDTLAEFGKALYDDATYVCLEVFSTLFIYPFTFIVTFLRVATTFTFLSHFTVPSIVLTASPFSLRHLLSARLDVCVVLLFSYHPLFFSLPAVARLTAICF